MQSKFLRKFVLYESLRTPVIFNTSKIDSTA